MPTDTVPCTVCGDPIRQHAKKCIHCDSFQDWRRHFSFSTVVLSLFIALISVSTTAVHITRSVFAPEQSNLRFSLVQYGPDSIRVVSSNLGDRAGVLRAARLTVINGPRGDKQTFELKWEEGQPVVEPGNWRIFALYPLIGRARAPLRQLVSANEDCKHVIDFEIIAFDHDPETKHIEYRCPSP